MRLEALVAQDRDLLKVLVKEALDQILQAEMTKFLGAAPGERSAGRVGYRAGYYERGLVTRVLHPTDQRSVLIELTAAGKALALATMEEFAAVEETLMGEVSKADRAKVNAFLKKVLHSIEAKLDL